ncbi:P-loop containing nucleoside triphosphate hydrolase protein [Vararia minispora EC-137]|uniref:P-loop containing nucleoside triphosphate hydrolase protein n=1 Tax=Vararia minispora EC-137 TaxID=1314806 RepID=A0ACB8QYX7_9AGAM|nr:P-loop containing nucleoside triphosphate hydrolase protein [Vararia minispora EC-137]
MPPFMPPETTVANGVKRKAEISEREGSRKRQAGEPIDWTRAASSGTEQYWMVQWRSPQGRKHKTWEGDGVIVVNASGRATLMDQDGKILSNGKVNIQAIDVGEQMSVGSKEIEIDRSVARADYLSGACFGRATAVDATPSFNSSAALGKKFVPLRPVVVNPGTSLRQPSATATSKVASALHVFEDDSTESCWTANWRKPQQKKHKTWDGDAFVIFRGGKLILISEAGKILGNKPFEGARLYSGFKNFIAGREIEIDVQVPRSKLPAITGVSQETENEVDPDTVLSSQSVVTKGNSSIVGNLSPTTPPLVNSPNTAKKYVPPMSFYAAPALKKKAPRPLHDPDAEGAIVLKEPDEAHRAKFNKKNLPVIPVVIDPLLARRLRPHQIEGVRFLYECVMGLRKHEGQGCILADDMGLGKTLQAITLVWTLLKQNPYADKGPVVGKVLIACPVSLTKNWKNEFQNWLGRDRVGIIMGDQNKRSKNTFQEHILRRRDQVLIIGYERLRKVIADLAYCSPPIGLVIADEAHRLKSTTNKTYAMFDTLRTKRRIMLSGTPIQNDLSEFHAMADFCNPGLLDEYQIFRRLYEQPILRSRTPGCSEKDIKLGEARSAQEITRSFVLRRDASIIQAFLPPKHEYVVFVTPTALQLLIFSKILNPDKLDHIIHDSTADALAMITLLNKISNSPILLKAVTDKGQRTGEAPSTRTASVQEAVKLLPAGAQPEDVALSGKLTALATMLRVLKRDTNEKCILVSHYTSTLNVLQAFCERTKYTFLRLDGSTPQAKRSQNVQEFNQSSQEKCFLFLLSSKAGGVGLNLIGASRLFLVDSDWNPSHDLQSMARIHRDGQKREVFIYRLLTAGAIDEKIYQRQVTKLGLSDNTFSPKELRDIFTVHPNTLCHTHELLDCHCDYPAGTGEDGSLEGEESSSSDEEGYRPVQFMAASQVNTKKADRKVGTLGSYSLELKRKKDALAALGQWKHINCLKGDAGDHISDSVLLHLLNRKQVPGKAASEGKKKERTMSLLEAVDLDNISSAPADTIPGGTLSFLFEKVTDNIEDKILEADDSDAVSSEAALDEDDE